MNVSSRVACIAVVLSFTTVAHAQRYRVYDQVCIDEETAKCGEKPPPPIFNAPAVVQKWNAWHACMAPINKPSGQCVRDMGEVIAKGNEALLKAYLDRVQAVLERLESTGITAGSGAND